MAGAQSSGPETGTVQNTHIYGMSFKYCVEKEGRDRKMEIPVEIKTLIAFLHNLCRDKTKFPTVGKILFYVLRALPYLLLQ